ncbi:pyruvate oxidase, partial [Bifidobacterium longum]|nr:pyruvate oxidase [Bifidobacterium longum]
FKNALNRAYRVQNMPVLINAYVSDHAPLPGKIVGQDAKGYMKFGSQYLKEEKKIPELPPLKDILRQFF